MGVVGRLDQYASMLAWEFDDYSMSENLITHSATTSGIVLGVYGSGGSLPTGWVIDQGQPGTTLEIIGYGVENGLNYIDLKFSGTTSTTNRWLVRPGNPLTITSGVTYSSSVYAKTISGTPTDYRSFGDAGLTLTNSTLTRYSGSSTSGSTGTFYPRLDIGYNSISTVMNFTIRVAGFQLEVGSVATDYTPTTTTAINRVLASTTNTNITGLGTYYSSGFYENVGVTTFLNANVFAPYDPVYDEFSGTSFGAGQGRYMRQNTDKSVVVYNEIDEVTDLFGRGIVRDGLVLDLDAGNTASYSGSGTTWTDLSASGNIGTLTNGPTYNSANGGSIVFDGTNDYIDCGLATFQPTSITLCTWVSHTNSSDSGIIVKGDVNEATEWGLSFGYSSPHYLVGRATTYTNQLLYPWTGSLLTGFHYVCYTMVNNTSATLYVDGVQVASTNTIGSIGLNAKNVLIGKWNNYAPIQGNIAQVSIYNRALTASEVAQNYNALKGRYGL